MKRALAFAALLWIAAPACARPPLVMRLGSFYRLPPQFVEKTTLAADVCNGNCATTTWTLTITHTVSTGVKDPALVIIYAQNDCNTGSKSGMNVATILVDGAAATQRKTWGPSNEASPCSYGELWTFSTPSAGSHTVLFVINSGSQSAGDRHSVSSVQTYAGVDPLTPTVNSGSATGSVSSAEHFTIATADDQTVVGCYAMRQFSNAAAAAGQAVLYANINSGGAGGNGLYGSSSTKNFPASTEYTYTSTNGIFAMGGATLQRARR